MAIERVAKRVSKGGHHIPDDVINRRYYRGITNLLDLYIPVCNKWLIVDNRDLSLDIIAHYSDELGQITINNDIWETIKIQRK